MHITDQADLASSHQPPLIRRAPRSNSGLNVHILACNSARLSGHKHRSANARPLQAGSVRRIGKDSAFECCSMRGSARENCCKRPCRNAWRVFAGVDCWNSKAQPNFGRWPEAVRRALARTVMSLVDHENSTKTLQQQACQTAVLCCIRRFSGSAICKNVWEHFLGSGWQSRLIPALRKMGLEVYEANCKNYNLMKWCRCK